MPATVNAAASRNPSTVRVPIRTTCAKVMPDPPNRLSNIHGAKIHDAALSSAIPFSILSRVFFRSFTRFSESK
jgi:hypothetical protein